MKIHQSTPVRASALGLVLTFAGCATPTDALIDQGRELLAEGETQAALERFEQASARDTESTDARVWIVRGWLAEQRIDDSLQATDELKAAGAPQPDLDYLYGLGFHANALRAVTSGSSGVFTQGEFEDAARFLTSAVEADAERYSDAYLPLAESGWYAQDLAAAHDAVMRAVELRPERSETHMMHGRISFSSYSQAVTDELDPEQVDAHWSEALGAFEQASAAALAALEAGDESARAQAIEATRQIAMLHVWNEDLETAAVAFADGIVLDPWGVDMNQVITYVGGENFLAEIGPARAAYVDREGPDASGVALLDWWIGFANFGLGRMPEAERAFDQVIAGNPTYTSAWYYLFRAAYGQRDHEGAVFALRAAWHQAPDELVGLIASERDLNLAILEYLAGWLVNEEKQVEGTRPREAAILAEVMTRVAPDEARYWNNLGLFLRDYGEGLQRVRPKPRDEDLEPLWEAAYAAYSRTLELEPDNAGYLNDTAVMLHYHLERDYDLALDMYARAEVLAKAELDREDLSSDLRDWMLIAHRDARNNQKLLTALMSKTAQGRN